MGNRKAYSKNGNGSAAWYLTEDGTGNVSTVTNGGSTAAASVACTVRYDPYGTPLSPVGADNPCNTGSTESSAFYRGARRDKATGSYQFGSRTYDPAKAAFLTPDGYRAEDSAKDLSIGVDPLTNNRYSYVNGDPVNLVDPDGHFSYSGAFCQANDIPADECYELRQRAKEKEQERREHEEAQKRIKKVLGGRLCPAGTRAASVTQDRVSATQGRELIECVRPEKSKGLGLRLLAEGLGFVPIVGDAVDGALCVYDLAKKNEDAALGCLAIIPVVGGVARGAKWARKGDKVLDAASDLEKADDYLLLTIREAWGDERTLQRHFRDHAADFGASTIDEYVDEASLFFQRANRERFPTKIDEDGVIRVYDPVTNTLGAYNADGTIKSFFKPSGGQRYWDLQPGVSPWEG